jgi:hypothetical protein
MKEQQIELYFPHLTERSFSLNKIFFQHFLSFNAMVHKPCFFSLSLFHVRSFQITLLEDFREERWRRGEEFSEKKLRHKSKRYPVRLFLYVEGKENSAIIWEISWCLFILPVSNISTIYSNISLIMNRKSLDVHFYSYNILICLFFYYFLSSLEIPNGMNDYRKVKDSSTLT